jgi:DNA helicase-2/ATP-dependent DNA helicase PcrA
MQSNFSVLKDLDPDLFNYIHEAEKLFIDGYNNKVATQLRRFCEGFLKLCFGLKHKKITIQELKNEYNYNKMFTPNVCEAIDQIHWAGNKACHHYIGNNPYPDKDIIELFKCATKLVNYLIKKIYKKNILAIVFDINILPRRKLEQKNQQALEIDGTIAKEHEEKKVQIEKAENKILALLKNQLKLNKKIIADDHTNTSITKKLQTEKQQIEQEKNALEAQCKRLKQEKNILEKQYQQLEQKNQQSLEIDSTIAKKYEEKKTQLEEAENKILVLSQNKLKLNKKIIADDHKNTSITKKLQTEKQQIEQEKNALETQYKRLEQEKNILAKQYQQLEQKNQQSLEIDSTIAKKYEEKKTQLEEAENKILVLSQNKLKLNKKIIADDHKNTSITKKLQTEKQQIEQEKNALETQYKQLEQEKNILAKQCKQLEQKNQQALEIDRTTAKKHEEKKAQLKEAENRILALSQEKLELKEKIKADDHTNTSLTKELQAEKQQIEQEKNELEEKCKQLEQQLQIQSAIQTPILTTIEQSLDNKDFDSQEQITQELQLNKAQQEIIALTTGKHLLQAPPGTGKTSVLTERVKLAINKYDEEQILCLTFTNKAATELRHRVKKVIGKRHPFIGTFHGFCLNVLRDSETFNKQFNNFSILDDYYRTEILDNIIKNIQDTPSNVKVNDTWFALCNKCYLRGKPKYLKKFTSLFFSCYVYMILIDDYLNINLDDIIIILRNQIPNLIYSAMEEFHYNDKMITANKIWQVFNQFKQAKFNYKTLDFDDILFLGLQELIQQKITQDFIQVDEVQDLSPIQWGIIKQLSHRETHLLVAGDPEQLIYSFRNASITLFNKNTKNYQSHSLMQNYRSTAEIINLLNSYRQYHWQLPAMQTTITNTEKQQHLIEYTNEEQELAENIQLVKQMPLISKKNVAIVLRSNNACKQYYDELKNQGLNCIYLGSGLMNKAVIQDWLSLLRIYRKSESTKDWWRLVYRFAKNKTKMTKSKAMEIVNHINAQGITPADILTPTQGIGVTDNYPIKLLINAFNNQGVILFDAITISDKLDAKIIKLTAVKIIQGKITAEFSQCINQDFEPYSELKDDFLASQKFTNISLEDIATASSFAVVAEEFFKFITDCPLISHDDGFNYSILRLNLQQETNNYDLLDYYYKLHDHKFSSLSLSLRLFPRMKSYKPEYLIQELGLLKKHKQNANNLVILVTEIINQLQQRITNIDNILTEYQDVFTEVIKHYQDIDSMLEALVEGDKQVELADILTEWFAYAKQQPNWYKKNSLEITEEDIQKKLVPWLITNEYRGVFDNLVNEKNPLVERLFTLQESDLIDTANYDAIVCTIHGAKGLEFKTVLVPQAIEKNYNTWYGNREAIRLLYVALSRATESLVVSYTTSYKDNREQFTKLTELLAPCKENFLFAQHK